MSGHKRSLIDQVFGRHEEADAECWGTLCEDCGCCMHCDHSCVCSSGTCGCEE